MPTKTDAARKQTDKAIFKLHKLCDADYTRAVSKLRRPLEKHYNRHEKTRKKLLERLDAKEITREEYRKRRIDDLMDEDFLLLLDDDADTMSKATRGIWKRIVDAIPNVYAENYNYGMYRAEQETGKSYLEALLTEEIVRRMWKANPDMIKMPGKSSKMATGTAPKKRQAESIERIWQKQLLQTAVMMTADLPFPVKENVRQIIDWIRRRNISTGNEYVTTAMNGAENKARTDAFEEADKDDHILMRGWVAIMDERTRIAHRKLDGEWVGMEEPWEVDGYKLMYPGDPDAPAYLIYGCRCSVEVRLAEDAHGSTHQHQRYKGLSYEEWKAGKNRKEWERKESKRVGTERQRKRHRSKRTQNK